MFFAQHVAFLVRILVRECIFWKKVKKPFVLPLQIFGNTYFKCVFCQTLIFKAFLKTARAVAGRLAMNLLHAYCVFLCIPLFEPKWEPLEVPSVREKSIMLQKHWFYCVFAPKPIWTERFKRLGFQKRYKTCPKPCFLLNKLHF